MRLLIEFSPTYAVSYREINNYFIHSMIWRKLKNTTFSDLHDSKGFKYFNFSNIFPVEDFVEGKRYKLIISSPMESFIYTLKDQFEKEPLIRLGKHIFVLSSTKVFKLPLGERWELGSPLVLYKNNFKDEKKLEYYSFEKHKDFEFFFNRIKENALKKYNSFTGKEFDFKFFMFDSFRFKRTVVHKLNKDGKEFVIIGTLGEFELPKIRSKEVRKFYEFVQEVGLGEKNSLGYGFLNPWKNEQ
ncbi:MAG: CRISPR-associated endoribonuclease Cas6 [Candidatus Woesearchaeota archaeon]